MDGKKLIVYGFGTLLLVMATTQFMGLSYFSHIMRHYLLPMGDGVKLLTMFYFPLTLVFMAMHAIGACGILLLSNDNALKPVFIKIGVTAMVIWVIILAVTLLRDVPTDYVGFFGEKLRQPVNILALLQSVLFAIWGWFAYKYATEEDAL